MCVVNVYSKDYGYIEMENKARAQTNAGYVYTLITN